jgi:hypothetical protein
MKDKLLYLTIGLLIGVVVMQWRMPSGQATIITPPVGDIVGVAGDHVLATNGDLWVYLPTGDGWTFAGSIPVPVNQVQFIDSNDPSELTLVDKSGNCWRRVGGGGVAWVNRGGPPIGPVQTKPETWGGVKGKYDGKK